MSKPFVFIILPVFNGEKYILQQLMSIYYQSFSDWYLIIVNDGSIDNSIKIAKSFVNDYKLQDKVTIFNKENNGLNKAIESGLIESQKIKGKLTGYDFFVSYCDSDDVWMRNKLEFQLNYMLKNKGDLCYCDLILIDENDNLISDSYNKILRTLLNNIYDNSFSNFCLSNHITATSMLFRYDFVEKILPLCNGLYQDWITCLVVSGLNGKILPIKKSLAYYRRHPNAMTGPKNKKTSSDFFNEFINVLENIKGRLLEENQEIANYMIDYYRIRLKYKKKIYKYFILLKYPKIAIYYLKSIISYFLK